MSTLRTVVADAHDLVRLGLIALLDDHPHVEVVGDAKSRDTLCDLLQEQQPDLAVVDLTLPGLEDDLAEPLRDAAGDRLRVLVVSDDTTDAAVMRTFRAAANGFLVKADARSTLEAAVDAIAAGGTYIDPAVGSILIRLSMKGLRGWRGPHGLTVQELHVAVLLAEDGLTNRQIGRRLGIRPGTVKRHVANVVTKLGAYDRYGVGPIVKREGIHAPGR